MIAQQFDNLILSLRGTEFDTPSQVAIGGAHIFNLGEKLGIWK